ncbi:MAG TPA: hypothetical protein VMU39_24200 [Solirubrobacteraceae bacterium]|nr:hypothetical protein [Solirubrobacteraceae bacterium]
MGDWNNHDEAMADLSALPPEERLQTLLRKWTGETESLTGDDVRKLFVYAWPDGRDSVDDHSHELLTMLRWIAPVRDGTTYLVGELTIFRAAGDEHGIRWTLDEAVATGDEQAGIAVFRATVEASDVLGHFNADGGNEVLVNPQHFTSLERVSPA